MKYCADDFSDIATESVYSRTIPAGSSRSIDNLSDYHRRSRLSKEIVEKKNSDAEYSMSYAFQVAMQINSYFFDRFQEIECYLLINSREIEQQLGMSLLLENNNNLLLLVATHCQQR